MNVLEHYIKEVINETTICHFDEPVMIVARILVDCYGRVEEKEVYMLPDEWKEAKEKGYYLG